MGGRRQHSLRAAHWLIHGPCRNTARPMILIRSVRIPNANMLQFQTIQSILIALVKGGDYSMLAINERIKDMRRRLHLSQEYVAKQLGVSRSTFTQMENGNRKILAEELSKLSALFGISSDSLLNEQELSQPAAVFARSFEKLDESDQAEIMNLIRYKEYVKAQRSK